MTNEEKVSQSSEKQGNATTREGQPPPRPLKHTQSAHFQSEPSTDTQSDNSDEVVWRLTIPSSNYFEKIMTDIECKMVEQMKRQQELAKTCSQHEADQVIEKQPILLDLEDDENEEDTAHYKKAENKNNPLRIKARRAWALIRRHIREESMNKQNKSSLQWSMLKQTIKNITNMDAARGELYKKYLNPENPRPWAEGIKSIPQDFFAKHSKELMLKRTMPSQSPAPASVVSRKSSKKRINSRS